jgi:hypothetical protein
MIRCWRDAAISPLAQIVGTDCPAIKSLEPRPCPAFAGNRGDCASSKEVREYTKTGRNPRPGPAPFRAFYSAILYNPLSVLYLIAVMVLFSRKAFQA